MQNRFANTRTLRFSVSLVKIIFIYILPNYFTFQNNIKYIFCGEFNCFVNSYPLESVTERSVPKISNYIEILIK